MPTDIITLPYSYLTRKAFSIPIKKLNSPLSKDTLAVGLIASTFIGGVPPYDNDKSVSDIRRLIRQLRWPSLSSFREWDTHRDMLVWYLCWTDKMNPQVLETESLAEPMLTPEPIRLYELDWRKFAGAASLVTAWVPLRRRFLTSNKEQSGNISGV